MADQLPKFDPKTMTSTPLDQDLPKFDPKTMTSTPLNADIHLPNPGKEGVYGMRDDQGTLNWVPFGQVNTAQENGLTFDKPEYESQYNKDHAQAIKYNPNYDKPGFFESVAKPLGLGDLWHHDRAGLEKVRDLQEHPVQDVLRDLAGPAGQIGEGLWHGGERSLSELAQAGRGLNENNFSKFGEHAAYALPFIGAGIQTGVDQRSPSYGFRDAVAKTLTNPGVLGTVLGNAASVAPMLMGETTDAAFDTPFGKAISEGPSNFLMNRGVGTLNRAVGIGKKAFGDKPAKFGATDAKGNPIDVNTMGENPALGYFQHIDQNYPWWQRPFRAISTESGLADKAEAGRDVAGRKIGEKVNNASWLPPEGVIPEDWDPADNPPGSDYRPIPYRKVADAILGPYNKAHDVLNGPYGPGSSALDERMTGLKDFLNDNFQGHEEGGRDFGLPYDPRDVQDIKHNVASNISWTDPTQIGLKQVGQQITGGLGGAIADEIPSLRPLNSVYKNLTPFAEAARSRANTGPTWGIGLRRAFEMGAGLTPGIMSHSPLEALSGAGLGIALESTPVKSGLASGLYYGGKALGSEFPSLHNLVPSLRLPDMPSGVMDESGGWGPFGRGKKNDGPLGVPNDTSFDTPWADKERTNKPGFSTSRGGSYVAPPTNIEGVPSIPDTPLFNAEEAHKSDLRDIVAPSGGKSRTYGEINPIVSRLLDKHGIDNPDPGSYIPDEPRVKPQLPSEDQETSIENNHSFQDTVAKYLAKYKDVPPPLQDLFNETERHRNTRGLAARYLAHPDEIPPGVKKIVTDPEKE